MQRVPPAVCDADLPPSSDIISESTATARLNCRMPTPGLIARRRGHSYHLDPIKIWKTDTHADVERGSSGMGSDIEEETFSIYGKPAPLYSKDSSSIYKDDASLVYPDASLGSDVLSNLKAARIDKFLWIRKLLILAIIFSVSFSMIFALFMSLPKIHRPDEGLEAGRAGRLEGGGDESVERLGIEAVDHNPQLLFKFPKNMGELRVIRGALEVYQKEHRRQVQIGIVCLYLFLQTFMIPGSIFINILAGSLYGFYEALLLVLILAGVGSSLCYCLSNFILKEIVYYYFPDRCEWLAREVHRHRHNLLNYMLFLRITPILPNWFINVSSPLVGVPYRDFVIGTTVGLIPASVVGVKAGGILSTINSLGDLYDFWTIATFSFIAVLVLLPVVIKSRYDRRGPTLIKTI
ncbi:hypothetical protein Mapa_003281 [Marchantia paleacea]|nr:hypothetical protein Mapa_003281 [Marchantia paleacea]